jgi:hypothetical protein
LGYIGYIGYIFNMIREDIQDIIFNMLHRGSSQVEGNE